MINFFHLTWDGSWETANSIASFVAMSIVAGTPVAVSMFILKFEKKLMSKAFKKSFGALYDGMKINDKGEKGLTLYLAFYYIRMLALAMTVVLLGHALVI